MTESIQDFDLNRIRVLHLDHDRQRVTFAVEREDNLTLLISEDFDKASLTALAEPAQ